MEGNFTVYGVVIGGYVWVRSSVLLRINIRKLNNYYFQDLSFSMNFRQDYKEIF